MNFDLVSKLLFPAPSSSYGVDSFEGELLWVPRDIKPEGALPPDCIPCLFLPCHTARFLVFYLHSNAEDLGKCYTFCANVREQFQVHVFAVEYPGYGICPGDICNEVSVLDNVRVCLRFVLEELQRPLDSILVLGRSIGCGPAIALATEHKIGGLVLISPMLSLKELFSDNFGPLAYCIQERFPNKTRMLLVESPLLVVHGQQDKIIPNRHGVELYNVCRSRKLLVCPKDMGHNSNLLADVSYLVLPMLQFFALPDYCFEDLVIPAWATDKTRSPFYTGPRAPAVALKRPGPLRLDAHGSLQCPLKRELVEQQVVYREEPVQVSASGTAGGSNNTQGKERPAPSLLKKTGREPPERQERSASRSRLRAISGFEMKGGGAVSVPASRKDILRLMTPSDCTQMVKELKHKLSTASL
mmetsp:Transcript_123944/g.246762  ORF Transcript_123944/g.246762 Transcript_123944/m.246762 type:complete len:414 (+) Transcript_123944:34-1275(+)|eukprot:CAMPEP_0172668136 /NCGR_PEP_ID=MMETSP1074-20121228/8874_1 /TAXON_ID=2916 /ORGANISM="Ceratium fusus, Strain PA161109" /LENGTH=413 /DNA_ID=CAMNT_0013484749 /DNA_START=34 /DNA_END=1275 /DNA_ORIENTATION=+